MSDCKDISFLSWNVRGVSNLIAKRHIKEVTRKHKPTFLLIMETPCQFSRKSAFWNHLGYTPVHISEAHGHEGGLWVLVQQGNNLCLFVVRTNTSSITFSISAGSSTWMCTTVYASPTLSIRATLW